jgi:chromosome partitioning protein
VTTLALFNSKGGIGSTTLAYHLAHMFQRIGVSVLAADLDPQADLTTAFLDEDQVESLWDDTRRQATLGDAIHPLLGESGDIRSVDPVEMDDGLWLAPGDLKLNRFDDRLSAAWPRSFTGDAAALRVTTAFHRVIRQAAERVAAELVIIDVGPNLGAVNRAALLAADAVLVPLAADFFSLQGLRNLGPALRDWRSTWATTVLPHAPAGIDAPPGTMKPIGYVLRQPRIRLDRPAQPYDRWLRQTPSVFASSVLGGEPQPGADHQSEQYEIATLRHYSSLLPLARNARKPMFDLRTADGAIGSTQRYARLCYQEFESLAHKVLSRLEPVRRTAKQ